MLSKLSDCPYFSLVQKGQMNIIIRFWDLETNCVATRYLGSEFMGRFTDEDVLQAFLGGISDFTSQRFCRLPQTAQM